MKKYLFLSLLFLGALLVTPHTASAQRQQDRQGRERKSLREKRKRRTKRAKVEFKIGDIAPDFELLRLESLPESGKIDPEKLEAKDKVKLSSFTGETPVVLFLSSYT